jgi:hypothetical protein
LTTLANDWSATTTMPMASDRLTSNAFMMTSRIPRFAAV